MKHEINRKYIFVLDARSNYISLVNTSYLLVTMPLMKIFHSMKYFRSYTSAHYIFHSNEVRDMTKHIKHVHINTLNLPFLKVENKINKFSKINKRTMMVLNLKLLTCQFVCQLVCFVYLIFLGVLRRFQHIFGNITMVGPPNQLSQINNQYLQVTDYYSFQHDF